MVTIDGIKQVDGFEEAIKIYDASPSLLKEISDELSFLCDNNIRLSKEEFNI